MSENEQDRERVDRYRGSGDESAIEELVADHGKALLGFIMNMTHNADDARDLFQEVWLRAIRNLGSYRHGNFRGWLMRIARNALIDRRRTLRPTVSLDQQGPDGDRPALHETLPSSGPTPVDTAAASELEAGLQSALTELNEAQREVFLLRTQAGVPFREIARLQGVSINTALGRMHYAVQKLRARLAEFAPGQAGCPISEEAVS